jgi:hypothetical protein
MGWRDCFGCRYGTVKAVKLYLAVSVPVLRERVGDEDAQTKSNVIYAVGRLVERSGKATVGMNTL